MAKAAFSKKKTLFTRKLDLKLRKKLVKCYIWNIALSSSSPSSSSETVKC